MEEGLPPRVVICGVPISSVGPDRARDLMLASEFGVGRSVHLCNAYTLSLALKDTQYRALLQSSELTFADGAPVSFVARRRGHSINRRVYGPDLMLATMDAGRRVGLRHYLYGGSPPVLELLTSRLAQRFPGVQIVGGEAPPFRELTRVEATQMVNRLRDKRPDVVWVGLGTPRQDEFVAQHRHDIGATLVAVGAAFDFLSGVKRQAPRVMQDAGLEWLFRLATEPRRLWHRYLVGNTRFLLSVVREECARRHDA